MPYCFLGSSIKFQGHTGWKIDDINPIWLRLLSRSQLSNPSDLPCWIIMFTFTLVKKLHNFVAKDLFSICWTEAYELFKITFDFSFSSVFHSVATVISFNFLRLSDAYMHQWMRSSFLIGTKALSEPTLTRSGLDSSDPLLVKLESNTTISCTKGIENVCKLPHLAIFGPQCVTSFGDLTTNSL